MMYRGYLPVLEYTYRDGAIEHRIRRVLLEVTRRNANLLTADLQAVVQIHSPLPNFRNEALSLIPTSVLPFCTIIALGIVVAQRKAYFAVRENPAR